MREYSLLMVDDELFAVRGITEGISWEEFGITKVYGVCNVKEAKTILERERIDVVISDIEMPGKAVWICLPGFQRTVPEQRCCF